MMRRSGFRPSSISQSANWGIASENKLAAKDTTSASVVDRAVLVWRFDSQDKGTHVFGPESTRRAPLVDLECSIPDTNQHPQKGLIVICPLDPAPVLSNGNGQWS